MPDDIYILSARMARVLQDLEKFRDNLSVTGNVVFKKSNTTCSIHIPPAPRQTAIPSTANLVPVKLTQSGGSNGTKTSAATYTYDMKTFTTTASGTVTDGTTIGTAQSPLVSRPNGTATVAAYGLAMRASDGFKLVIAYEQYGVGGC